MKKLLIGLVALVATVYAADVTGTWTGPVQMKMGDETRDDSALLILKQTGATVTGSVGPNETNRYEISKGTVEGDSIVLEAVLQGENKLILTLKLDGEKLSGDLKAAGPDAPPLTGKLTLEKKK